jgi:hypothetical protein
MDTDDVAPLAFTVPLRAADVFEILVAGVVTTLGVVKVVKLSTAPYVVTPCELVATAWK